MTDASDIRNLVSVLRHSPPVARRGIETDLADCMVALPGQLFYSTQKFSLN